MSQIFCILSNFTTHSLPLKKSTIWVDRLRINSKVLFKPSSSLKPKLDLHWFSKRRKNPVVGKRGEEEDEFGRECLQQFVSSRPQVSCLTRDQQQPALFRVVVEKMLKPQRQKLSAGVERRGQSLRWSYSHSFSRRFARPRVFPWSVHLCFESVHNAWQGCLWKSINLVRYLPVCFNKRK